MENPKCNFCGYKHSIREPHIFQESASAHAKRTRKPKAAQPVTHVMEKVTRVPQSVTAVIRRHCPTCTCRGNQTHAERQRAYRERKNFFPPGAK